MPRLLPIIGLFLSCHAWAQQFQNEAFMQGIFYSQSDALYGGGVSFMDFDRDGDDDITFTEVGSFPIIYRNTPEGFELVYEKIPVEGEVKQCNWVDYDNDGLLDIVFSIYQGPIRFFRNTGNLEFVETTEEVGIPLSSWETFGHTWADYDRDGDLDVYIANYNGPGYGLVGIENFLYANNGDGTFTDVTAAAGVGDGVTYSFMGIWMYVNDDLWPDLYVSNDRYESENSMYINNGDGTFTDVSEISNTNVAVFSMGLAAEDYDNDGDEDIYIANWLENLLMENTDGVFQDIAPEMGVLGGQYTWGCIMADWDNDMRKDLFFSSASHFQANGTNQLYRNTGNGFVNITASAGMSNEFGKSYGAALGDVNNDGYLDIVTVDGSPTFSGLWINQGGSNHWLKMELHGVASNKDAIGTKIMCYVDGVQQMNVHRLGESYLSQFSNREHFGLGEHTMADSLVIHWPSGAIDKYYRVAADQTLQLYEGEGFLGEINHGENIELCTNTTGQVVPTSPHAGNVVWSNGTVGDTLLVDAAGSYRALLHDAHGNAFYSNHIAVDFFVPLTYSYVFDQVECAGETASLLVAPSEALEAVVINDELTAAGVQTPLQSGWNVLEMTDELGCMAVDSFFVNSFSPLTAIVNVEHALCPGDNNGAIAVQMTGGHPPYVWLSGSDQMGDLSADQYLLTVTDANGCAWQQSIEVAEPQPPVPSFSAVAPTCHGLNDGQVEVDWIGNLAGYQVTTTWQSNESLASGEHGISIQDANGCISTYSFDLTEPDPISVAVQITPATEGLTNGGLDLLVSGGTPPYSFWWSSGQGNVSSVSDLPEGNCTVLITDANDCAVDSVLFVPSVVKVSEFTDDILLCYPIPASEVLNVHSDLREVAFYNALGQSLWPDPIARGQYDISEWASGVYFLHGRLNGRPVSSTILKSP